MGVMKKAVVHIGSGKTGSTSIQRSLAKSIKKKRKEEVCYPVVDGYGHQNVEVLFKHPHELSRAVKSRIINKEGDVEGYKKKYQTMFSGELSKTQNLVLSSEYFFNFKVEHIKKLKKMLVDYGFYEVSVLAYLRSPVSYYLSYIQQQLKASHKFDSPLTFRYKMTKAISNWEEVFGKVDVHEYSNERLVNGTVIDDFNDFVRSKFNMDLGLANTLENKSIPLEGVPILQSYRKEFFPDENGLFNKETNKLIDFLSKYSFLGGKYRVKECVRLIIMNNHKEELQEICNKFGIFSDLTRDIKGEVDLERYSSSSFSRICDIVEDLDEEIISLFFAKILSYELNK